MLAVLCFWILCIRPSVTVYCGKCGPRVVNSYGMLFKGLRQCADPFRWMLQNRGHEKKHHVSTVGAGVVVAVVSDDVTWSYNNVFHLCPTSQTRYVIGF